MSRNVFLRFGDIATPFIHSDKASAQQGAQRDLRFGIFVIY